MITKTVYRVSRTTQFGDGLIGRFESLKNAKEVAKGSGEWGEDAFVNEEEIVIYQSVDEYYRRNKS